MGQSMMECLDKMDIVYPKGAGTNIIILPNEIVQLEMILGSPRIVLVARGLLEAFEAFRDHSRFDFISPISSISIPQDMNYLLNIFRGDREEEH